VLQLALLLLQHAVRRADCNALYYFTCCGYRIPGLLEQWCATRVFAFAATRICVCCNTRDVLQLAY
jgi:hypothetical protein